MKKSTLILSACALLSTSVFAQHSFDDYLSDSLIFIEIGSSTDGLIEPQDLDFVPGTFDLWVMNRITNGSFPGNYNSTGGSFITFMDAGQPTQTSQYRKDSHNNHFMMNASAVAMGDNGFFGTTGDVQNTNPSTPEFMGPSLWSHDTAKYAKLFQSNWATGQPLGSHYDMLHESPNPVGIAHDTANVYWVLSAYNGSLSRYDFVQDHGPGGSNHADGIIDRYTDVPFTRLSIYPSHAIIDKARKELYYVDGGPKRINKVDITSGTISGTLASQDNCTHRSRTGTAWSTVVSSGLVQPVGIDYYNDRLLVSDYVNGDIEVYDVSGGGATHMGTVPTGAVGIMGIKVDKDGYIWYVNKLQNKVYKIETQYFTSMENKNGVEKTLAWAYPNPSNGLFNIEINNATGGEVRVNVLDLNGKITHNQAFVGSFINEQMNLQKLSAGVYVMQVFGQGAGLMHTQKLIIR